MCLHFFHACVQQCLSGARQWRQFTLFSAFYSPLIATMAGGFLRQEGLEADWSVAPKGVSAIEAAWGRVRDVAKVPIRFVVETVINKALIGTFNRIATKFGVDKIDPVPLPAGFAAGGVLPGYTPGRDVHLFQSPTAGALALSGGEGIIRPEGTRALGADWVDGINRAARSGGVTGVQRWLGGYADGGILDRLSRAASRAKKTAGDALTGVKDLFSDPAGILKKLVEKILGLTPGGASTFRSMAMGMPKSLLDPVANRLKNLFSGPDGAPGGIGPGNSFGGSAGMMRILRAVFPGLRLISGFRPGSTTLSGNRSYHASDRAVDVPPDRAVAAWIYRTWGRGTRELITPYQQYNLLNGRPFTYTGAVWNEHNFAGGNAHVHWAYDQGGWLPPGLTSVVNNTGSPEAVLTSQQWSSISRMASHAEPGGRREYNFAFANTTLTPARLRALQDREDALALAGRAT